MSQTVKDLQGRGEATAAGSPVARLVAWNIRAGGGRRVDAIVAALVRWTADVVLLSEFRGTEPSRRLATELAARGLPHQLASCDPRRPPTNALLIASRWPLTGVRVARAPAGARWLVATVDAPLGVTIAAMHVPNRVSGLKYPFLDAVLGVARRWRLGPALFAGDTNSGRRGIDEEVPAFNAREEGWIDGLAACGWADAFRALAGARRAYTWYSPNGANGFRLDQAFVNAALWPRVRAARYAWGRVPRVARRDAVSDHAALVVDLELAARAAAGGARLDSAPGSVAESDHRFVSSSEEMPA